MATSIFATITIASQRQDGLSLEEKVAIYEGITLEELLARDAEIDDIHGVGFSANERNAHAQLDLLYEGFEVNCQGEYIYPDFFGGTYIDEFGNLVILIANTGYDRAYAQNILSNQLDSRVNYRFVEFSYNEMRSAVEYILNSSRDMACADLRGDACVYARNVTGVGIRSSANEITVFLAIYNDYMIEGFRRYVFDSPMISFEQLGGISFRNVLYDAPCSHGDSDCYRFNCYWINYHEEIADMNFDERNLPSTVPTPGMGIRTRAFQSPLLGAEGTVGFRARLINMPQIGRGFVTSAHQFTHVGGELVTRPLIGAHYVGTVINRSLTTTMDAAFVTGAPNSSNILPDGRVLSTFVTQPAFSGGVSMAGGTTFRYDGIVSGSILNTNFGFTCTCCRRNTFSGMKLTDISVRLGDSGGTVFATADRRTAGIVIAGQANMVFLPAHRILSHFGLERY